MSDSPSIIQLLRSRVRPLLKRLLHPGFHWLYRKVAAGARFYGDFTSWEDARGHTTGYDSSIILNRVAEAARKVKNREAAFERDSVLFDRIQYSWPLLVSLLWIASQKENCLRLVDFGGSLGGSYFQNKKFFPSLNEYVWCIVEQSGFVEIGVREFQDEHLKFYRSLEECCSRERPDVILLSSVIQYLPDPWSFLDAILSRRFNFIIVDRTPFFPTGRAKLMIQKVPASIYPASYPAWILPLDQFLSRFSIAYDLVEDFESADVANIPAVFKGFLFHKKHPCRDAAGTCPSHAGVKD